MGEKETFLIEYMGRLLGELKKELISRAEILVVTNSILIGGYGIVLSGLFQRNYRGIYTTIAYAIAITGLLVNIISTLYAVETIKVFPPVTIDTDEIFHFRVIRILDVDNLSEKIKKISEDNEILRKLFIKHYQYLSEYLEKRYTYLHNSFLSFSISIICYILTIIYIIVTILAGII